MNYYYDLCLNLKKDNPYKFYEWELDDELIEIKKIPLFKISESVLNNIYKYNGKIDEVFLKKIKNKTTYKKDGVIKTIMYAVIFTDTKSSIAIEFDEKGDIIKRSYLLLEDELNTIEIGFSLKKEKIILLKKEKIIYVNNLRQEELMRKKIKEELNNSFYNKEYNKIIYYHLEWFKKYNDNIKYIYKKMLNELEKQHINDLEIIYNLVLQGAK